MATCCPQRATRCHGPVVGCTVRRGPGSRATAALPRRPLPGASGRDGRSLQGPRHCSAATGARVRAVRSNVVRCSRPDRASPALCQAGACFGPGPLSARMRAYELLRTARPFICPCPMAWGTRRPCLGTPTSCFAVQTDAAKARCAPPVPARAAASPRRSGRELRIPYLPNLPACAYLSLAPVAGSALSGSPPARPSARPPAAAPGLWAGVSRQLCSCLASWGGRAHLHLHHCRLNLPVFAQRKPASPAAHSAPLPAQRAVLFPLLTPTHDAAPASMGASAAPFIAKAACRLETTPCC